MISTVVETTQLESVKSSFLIDIVRHKNGMKYVEIVQTIHQDHSLKSSVKINPIMLTDLIKTLQNYKDKIEKAHKDSKKYLSEEVKIDIQNRYFKGVAIKDLGVRFGLSVQMIETVLRNRGVEIVPLEPPRWRKWKYKKRRK